MRESYVPNLKVPKRNQPSRQMFLVIILCLILPPVGLVLLWGGARCKFRGKVCLTLVSVIIFALIICVILFSYTPESLYTAIPEPASRISQAKTGIFPVDGFDPYWSSNQANPNNQAIASNVAPAQQVVGSAEHSSKQMHAARTHVSTDASDASDENKTELKTEDTPSEEEIEKAEVEPTLPSGVIPANPYR